MHSDSTATRRCPKCDQYLPKSAYDRSPTNGEIYSYCRECRAKVYAERKAREIPPPNPSGLCLCGCGQKTPLAVANHSRLGLRKGHPIRYIAGHWGTRKEPYSIDPARYDIDPDTGCWNWKGCKNANGYGTIAVFGRCRLAHRLYYELRHGPIPDGLPLDHLCRNRGCVNPDHVEPVTHQVNSHRGAQTKLDWDKVRTIRASGDVVSISDLAARFGVCTATIRQVIKHHTWRE